MISLERVAGTQILLVALDFDGTLSPIVPRPDRAEIHPDSAKALQKLAKLPNTVIAVVSGRDIEDLQSRVPDCAGFWLAGSHGRAIRPPGLGVSAIKPDPRLDQFREVTLLPGIRREIKAFSVAFHWRGRSEGEPTGWLQDITARAQEADLEILDGRQVLEVLIPGAGKEVALERIAREVKASALFFAGDDRTDLEALVVAHGRGLGLFVSSSERAWMAPRGLPQVDGPDELALWLLRLAEAREEILARSRD
ncbi:MAG: trehalose-phosphatase [Fibrobacteria bacterium]|nr:trehalose-phosphatase [Fibrobacteria bacterium]